MMTLPEIVDRPEQTYAYIDFTVRMDQMQTPADEGFSRLFPCLASQNITPVAAPFYNYRRIDMANTLNVEAGVPVDRAGEAADGVRFGTLPAGRYATIAWHGHFDALEQVTAVLIGWCRLVGYHFDMHEADDGDHFVCRLEIYETNPAETPDPKDWVTTLAFKLTD